MKPNTTMITGITWVQYEQGYWFLINKKNNKIVGHRPRCKPHGAIKMLNIKIDDPALEKSLKQIFGDDTKSIADAFLRFVQQ